MGVCFERHVRHHHEGESIGPPSATETWFPRCRAWIKAHNEGCCPVNRGYPPLFPPNKVTVLVSSETRHFPALLLSCGENTTGRENRPDFGRDARHKKRGTPTQPIRATRLPRTWRQRTFPASTATNAFCRVETTRHARGCPASGAAAVRGTCRTTARANDNRTTRYITSQPAGLRHWSRRTQRG